MTNKLFVICLTVGLICAYGEYYWMRHGYRSLALVASKCPKPSIDSVRPVVHVSNHTTTTTIDSIRTWFWNIFATNKNKPIAPIVCETFEIHTDPRSTFILIKTFCLIGLTCKLISSLKTIPTLIRTRHATVKESQHLMATMPKGDGLMQQSKIVETSTNNKVNLVTTTTTIDKRTLPVR